LALVALELLAFLGDDLGRRIGGEALIREHLLAPGDLATEPRTLRLDVAVLALWGAVGLHDRVEDPLLVAVELRNHARATEDLRVLLDPLERARLGSVAPLRPRRAYQST